MRQLILGGMKAEERENHWRRVVDLQEGARFELAGVQAIKLMRQDMATCSNVKDSCGPIGASLRRRERLDQFLSLHEFLNAFDFRSDGSPTVYTTRLGERRREIAVGAVGHRYRNRHHGLSETDTP